MSYLEWMLFSIACAFASLTLMFLWILVAIWTPSDDIRTRYLKWTAAQAIITVWWMIVAGIWTLLAWLMM